MLTAMSKFAPEYTKEESIKLVLKELAWALPLYLVAHFWFFDWLGMYANNAHCYKYGSVTGVHLIMYGLFFVMPFTFGAILFHLVGSKAIQTIKLGQYPPPNQKVFKKTAYVYGIKAKTHGYLTLACISVFFVISIWGLGPAKSNTQNIKPCTEQLTSLASITHGKKPMGWTRYARRC